MDADREQRFSQLANIKEKLYHRAHYGEPENLLASECALLVEAIEERERLAKERIQTSADITTLLLSLTKEPPEIFYDDPPGDNRPQALVERSIKKLQARIQQLEEALREINKLIADGELVRNTRNDGDDAKFMAQSLALATALKKAERALGGKESQQPSREYVEQMSEEEMCRRWPKAGKEGK